jgi:hypothetical protein
MLTVAVCAPASHASTPGAATAGAKKSSCKKPRRPLPGRSAKKCPKPKKILLRRTYRGKTSQGQSIGITTNNFRKNVREVTFYAKHVCQTPYAGLQTFTEDFEMLFPVRLSGSAFTARVPSFDAEFAYFATVTGTAGASTATGHVDITAGGLADSACQAAQLSFSIPMVHEVRGIPR